MRKLRLRKQSDLRKATQVTTGKPRIQSWIGSVLKPGSSLHALATQWSLLAHGLAIPQLVLAIGILLSKSTRGLCEPMDSYKGSLAVGKQTAFVLTLVSSLVHSSLHLRGGIPSIQLLILQAVPKESFLQQLHGSLFIVNITFGNAYVGLLVL